ncbi:helix-turn-helix domain-containing protein [Rhizobium rhizogenes]|uniref:AraC family transcriptional regulator n=1 Tax=Rhizobium rhizogenes TaxID=359 RepID=UPI001572B44C|nr:helix-turn-helix transcriptional regulator [Rhizobium rhizogenes]NTF46534.1 AraC family transcriptional regulator [Rhizobium rhizogenes]
MQTFDMPEHNPVDDVSRSVFSLVTEATFVGETEPHRHNRAQLLYVIGGVLTVEASGGVWTVPPHCALWIPSGILHSGRISGHIKVASLYIDPTLSEALNESCGILFVQPFLRELIQKFDHKHRMDERRHARLAAVLIDELLAAPLEPIHLPIPTDRRLLRLTEAMLKDPGLRFTVDEWGARVGASTRTLSRLFQRETGMSFVHWRQQLHVGVALQRLAKGEQVTTIAGDLGYESVSAFIAMFKRMLGTTPARYFGSAVTNSAERDIELEEAAHRNASADIVPLKRTAALVKSPARA